MQGEGDTEMNQGRKFNYTVIYIPQMKKKNEEKKNIYQQRTLPNYIFVFQLISQLIQHSKT